ncbi:Bestrophin, RFP-TM, chloride channel-domain-containing protein [Protomyces lactucae-debilis]|uniref:Bestrophin, RFP-TM, chloride channel-domain-containing protein n=1 Tax=Protomyces lactucae-debilis TaxID=2754530 RepID=A0A1Y2FH96_PROLT|nr:Bestrophin, RFP-TM, chloride channel-domain-containing protein [Protomyces lactucae-debilis]ORY82636.1 Bestrophin, RFP-TM, chloride channel-domain-containing protein [Protomyces lactucae-debilis]
MITTLGFVVGLALSFRTTTAYGNWKEARTAWDKLNALSRNLARIFWVHCKTDGSTADVLRRKTAVNLVGYFAVALKHHLREERGHMASDLAELIPHLPTFSKVREEGGHSESSTSTTAGHPCYVPHPKDATANYTCLHGTLPTEITWHLGAFLEHLVSDRGMVPVAYGQAIGIVNGFSEVTSTCERILRNPVPPAYNIVISQLVWVFLIFLPFQLLKSLGWVSIPVTFISSAMIMGLAEIGLEVENPFGDDENDLDTDRMAQAIIFELQTLTTLQTWKDDLSNWSESSDNRPLYPFSTASFPELAEYPKEAVYDLLKRKATSVQTSDPLGRMGESRAGTWFTRSRSHSAATTLGKRVAVETQEV